jgi:Glycosyl transferase family 2
MNSASTSSVEKDLAVAVVQPRWKAYLNQLIAGEISAMTRYFDDIIQWLPRKEDAGYLLSLIDAQAKSTITEDELFPDLTGEAERRTAILLNGTLNHSFDIQELLMQLKPRLSRTSRIVIVAYNPYLSGLYRLANFLGIRKGPQPTTFVTQTDLNNLARLAGFDVVRSRPLGYVPFRFLGLGTLLNWILPGTPGIRALGLASIITLRPQIPSRTPPSLAIVIPARNEKGNIENALKRMPDLGCKTEIIFVEGHSSDGTWEEIQRVVAAYSRKFNVRAFRQTGKGKGDAVRLGFAHANSELLTILDADLTMPPELLERFYEAYCRGQADFVNGTRLVYPMEGAAMRSLNHLGNVFFAKALSAVLGNRIGDSLCGTKLLARHDYARMVTWRKDFGEFDPFGDFELLFPASALALGIVDVPIRYRARVYGTTNIRRFRDGLLLLKMTLIGLFRIKMGKAV